MSYETYLDLTSRIFGLKSLLSFGAANHHLDPFVFSEMLDFILHSLRCSVILFKKHSSGSAFSVSLDLV